jgi:hypothetical protein
MRDMLLTPIRSPTDECIYKEVQQRCVYSPRSLEERCRSVIDFILGAAAAAAAIRIIIIILLSNMSLQISLPKCHRKRKRSQRASADNDGNYEKGAARISCVFDVVVIDLIVIV